METISITREMLTKILDDAEILLEDVETAFDAETKKRIEDIKTGKDKGKTEQEYYDYLSKRGIKIAVHS